MAETTAGDLIYRVAFLQRQEIAGAGGETRTNWVERFQCRAAYRHLRGGENVIADRLAGKHPQLITVRVSSLVRQVTTDWAVRDVRQSQLIDGKITGLAFNIRDITHETDRMFITLLCESGVPLG